jgi:hypothetical protein
LTEPADGLDEEVSGNRQNDNEKNSQHRVNLGQEVCKFHFYLPIEPIRSAFMVSQALRVSILALISLLYFRALPAPE